MEIIEPSAYSQDERFGKIAQWINGFKASYFDSAEFHRYKSRREIVQNLVDQVPDVAELAFNYKFMLGLCRKHKEAFLDTCKDVFDADKWLNLSSLKSGADNYLSVDAIEHFANNVLQDCDYRNHWLDRLRFLPVYGWSPSFVEYRWNAGYSVKPKESTVEASGIEWGREFDEMLSRPNPIAIHPFNWFGDVNTPIRKQFRQGFIRRWGVREVIQAKEKVAVLNGENGVELTPLLDENGMPVTDMETGEMIMEPVMQPLYNTKALDEMLEELKNGARKSDKDYYDKPSRDGSLAGNDGNHISNSNTQKYIDVVYYIGTLDEVEGFEGDSNIYVVECYGDDVLRVAEHPIDTMLPITHIQTHQHETDCFTDSMLDITIPHDKIMNMLVNIGIENTVNDAHRVIVAHEDDYLNFDVLQSPKNLTEILMLKSGSQRVAPVQIDNQSGSLQSLLTMYNLIGLERQKAGVTDQELGVQQIGEKTATAARILSSATNKSTRATIKEAVAQGLLPEVRYIMLLAMQFYPPEKLALLSKDGEILRLTPNIAQMLVNRNGLRINDNFTRDKDSDSVALAEFVQFARPIVENLSTPSHAINLVRSLAKLKGIDEILDIDMILPKPMSEAETQAAQMPQGQPIPMPNGGAVTTDEQVAQPNPMDAETPQQVDEVYNG